MMKALVQLENLNCPEDKRVILRNLSRIMDIRIIDVDVERGLLLFLYTGLLAVKNVRQELSRLGYAVTSCKFPVVTPSILYGDDTSKVAAI